MINHKQSPDQLRSRYDVVVIGSGHNGLVAAAYLARTGLSVLVLEKNDYLGGATASQRVFPDYDAQLSRYAYLVSLFPEKIIHELNLDFRSKRRETASFTPYQDASGNQRGLVISNVDQERSRNSVIELTGDVNAWNRYQQFLQLELTLAELVWPTLCQPVRSRSWFQDRLFTPGLREAWESFIERPLGEVIERYIDHDVLRGLILTDGKIGVFADAHHSSLLQNRCFLYHVIGNGTGEWRVPVGGMRSVVDSLYRRCCEWGVTFATHANVQTLHASQGTATLQFVDPVGKATNVDADYVLVNAGPRTLARLIGRPWIPEPSDEGSVIKINMLLKRLPRVKASGVSTQEAFCGSFHLDEGYQQLQRSYASAKSGELPNPAPGEMYCHTLTDPSILSADLQQQGFHTLTLFGLDFPYRLFQADHDQRRARVLQSFLDGLDRVCGESFLDCLATGRDGRPCIEIKTPQDLEDEVDLAWGNIFHNQLSWFFSDDPVEEGRWGVETEWPNVILAGSAAFRGGAVSGIPGHNAAQRVMELRARR